MSSSVFCFILSQVPGVDASKTMPDTSADVPSVDVAASLPQAEGGQLLKHVHHVSRLVYGIIAVVFVLIIVFS